MQVSTQWVTFELFVAGCNDIMFAFSFYSLLSFLPLYIYSQKRITWTFKVSGNVLNHAKFADQIISQDSVGVSFLQDISPSWVSKQKLNNELLRMVEQINVLGPPKNNQYRLYAIFTIFISLNFADSWGLLTTKPELWFFEQRKD